MDVCTLMMATTLSMVCLPPDPPHCEIDRGVKYCDMQPTCKAPDPTYDCVRPNGTHYTRSWLDHPTFTQPD